MKLPYVMIGCNYKWKKCKCNILFWYKRVSEWGTFGVTATIKYIFKTIVLMSKPHSKF